MKRVIIIGATSGIGLEVAKLYIHAGWQVGIAGRRLELLETLRRADPERIEIQQLDVTKENAPGLLLELIGKLGGMDLFIYSSGIGSKNPMLKPEIELSTVETNTMGFTRMIDAAWHYFRQNGGGHIAAISSIAGTKALGIAPSYSATKRFQNIYLDALTQLARMENIPIRITDIRPGFVDTALISGQDMPITMKPKKVAQHIVKAIERKKRVVTIDWRYRLLVFFWRLIPDCLWVQLKIIRPRRVS